VALLADLLDQVNLYGYKRGIAAVFNAMPLELRRAIVVYVDSDFTKDAYAANKR
jgi:hypothetical protein